MTQQQLPSYEQWRAEQPHGPSMYTEQWDTENTCEQCGRPTHHGTGECAPQMVGVECRPRSNHGREIAPYLTGQDITERIAHFEQMKRDLIDRKKITPRSVIGTGYRGDTRKLAAEWIQQQIDDHRAEQIHREYP